MKRSNQKLISKEARILRHMRLSRKISLNQAGRLVNISGPAIAHIEGGRMDVSRARTVTMVEAYGYTMDEYLEFLDLDELPINHRDECMTLIRQMEESKLQMVYGILSNFAPKTTAARN